MTFSSGPGLGLIAAFLVLLIDQITKWWVISVMTPPREIVITPFFNLVMVWNRGISFGLFNNGGANAWFLSAVALAIVVFLGIWLLKTGGRLLPGGLGLVIGGALGNVIDRVFREPRAVADFLDFHWTGYHWPAFNVADAAITVGAAILVYDSLFMGAEKHKNGSLDHEKND
ncbi:MAG: signal peptidase II [Rhodospirillales bacterium]|nr:signal peptidase II [Rhodospirillales bacterium]